MARTGVNTLRPGPCSANSAAKAHLASSPLPTPTKSVSTPELAPGRPAPASALDCRRLAHVQLSIPRFAGHLH